jgi:hypothetical protein
MKETTKPKNTKQSHLLKRDLAENIAVLPLPTPPARAWGEGCGFAEATVQTMKADSDCSSRRQEAPSDRSSIAGDSRSSRREEAPFELSPIDLQFPQFMDIAARRDEPLSLSQETILTLTTEHRIPNL